MVSQDQERGLVKILHWQNEDIEERIGVTGGKYTDVNAFLTLFMGVGLTALFYGGLWGVGLLIDGGSVGHGGSNAPSSGISSILSLFQTFSITLAGGCVDIFFHRGITPVVISLFTCWSLSILFVKWRKLIFQTRVLTLMVVPQSAGFELNQESARDILSRMYGLVDDPRHFVLLNRIERALANLQNMGMVADLSALLTAQAQNDEDRMESSYGLVRGFVWAIPVLGFIGTVLGLSRAIGSFGTVLGRADGIGQLKTSLQEITSGLSIAFDTTLIALIAALFVQLIMVGLKKREEHFLDACSDYCHANIISKLRLSNNDEK